jgi:hypothetical protein
MTDSRRSVLLWCGLAIAFSPVLQDLAESALSFPSQRYVLLAPLMIGLLLVHPSNPPQTSRHTSPHTKKHSPLGIMLLILGMGAQILGITTSTWLFARVGLALAILGVALLAGRPNPMILLLTFGLVPIPEFITHATSPWLESILGAGAAQVLSFSGLQLEVGGPLLEVDGDRFELVASDSGIVTAALLAEAGWYSAVSAGFTFRRSLVRALQGALLVAVIQPVAVLLCVSSLPIGLPEVGRFLLTHDVPILLATAIVTQRLLGRPRFEQVATESPTGD